MEEELFKFIGDGVCAPIGFTANGIYCGLGKLPTKNDLGLILANQRCPAAAVYTTNKVQGAPLTVTKEHLADGMAQGIIINSVNANTCNVEGLERAYVMARAAAGASRIDEKDMLVASTGVIGQPLPIRPIEKGVDQLAKGLSRDGSERCAQAIMTTDTRKKEFAIELDMDGNRCRIGGMAKGSGMIHPNMATMLCFITTDISISSKMLQKALKEVVKRTFNRVSVDGDTSTNDMCIIMASGQAGNKQISSIGREYFKFTSALYALMSKLAKEVARDGEGATKLIECTCSCALNEQIAESVAKSVICSSLFKTAMFAADANWGRILCAIGYANANFDISRIGVSLSSQHGTIKVCENGSGVAFSEEYAKKILSSDEIKVLIELNSGNVSVTCWGCDLTYDYVKINAAYRS